MLLCCMPRLPRLPLLFLLPLLHFSFHGRALSVVGLSDNFEIVIVVAITPKRCESYRVCILLFVFDPQTFSSLASLLKLPPSTPQLLDYLRHSPAKHIYTRNCSVATRLLAVREEVAVIWFLVVSAVYISDWIICIVSVGIAAPAPLINSSSRVAIQLNPVTQVSLSPFLPYCFITSPASSLCVSNFSSQMQQFNCYCRMAGRNL